MTELPNGSHAPGTAILLADLQDRGLLAVQGPDAAKFLQGQLTCDIRELTAGALRRGAHCNIKGRMLFSLLALQTDEQQILLSLHGGLVNDALAALGKYIVFSKAELRNVTEQWRLLGLAGDGAGQLLQEQLGATPENHSQWQAWGQGLLLRLDENRYQCWLPREAAAELWQKLAPHCQSGDQLDWSLLEIRAGLGEVRPQTRELFTPQNLNFQLTHGVSFHKGCYTGQEVVARLHYKGKLKRHMYRFAGTLSPGQSLPEPGDALVHCDTGQAVGQVVLAAPACAQEPGFELLADTADHAIGHVCLADDSEQKLVQLPLPYAIPSEGRT